MLGPCPPAPPSVDLLPYACNKSAVSFTDGFAFHAVPTIGSLVGFSTSDHSPGCEASFPQQSPFHIFWLFLKSWYQVTVSLSGSDSLAPTHWGAKIKFLWIPGMLGIADPCVFLLCFTLGSCVTTYTSLFPLFFFFLETH